MLNSTYEAIYNLNKALKEQHELTSLSDFVSIFNNAECIQMVHDFVCDPFKLANSENKKWKQMNLKKWIAHSSHPCPIITIHPFVRNARINNYKIMNIPIKYKYNINMNTVASAQYTKGKIMLFQQTVDNFLMLNEYNPDIIDKNKFFNITLHEIIHKRARNSLYLLVYPKTNDHPRIILMVQRNNRQIRNAVTNKTTIIGRKLKMHIILNQINWDNYTSDVRSYFYQMSHYFANMIMNEGIILGEFLYYYKYSSKYMEDKQQYIYSYIDYIPSKPLPSITKYYLQYNDNEILTQQNAASPPNHKISKTFDINTKHKFFTGIILKDEVINIDWQNTIYREIMKLVKKCKSNKFPENIGIYFDKIQNRYKFFFKYWYEYRVKGKTTTNIHKSSKIANNLRLCSDTNNIGFPLWIKNLIQYLKNTNFISSSIKINQIGINYYFNEKNDGLHYSYIQPHKECDKFTIVYTISIYKNCNNYSFLSFNMKSKCMGDIKIPLKNRAGQILQSYLFIYLFICLFIN